MHIDRTDSGLVAIHILFTKNYSMAFIPALILFYGNLSAIFHFVRGADCNRCVILFYFILSIFFAFRYSFGNFHSLQSTNGNTYKMYCARALFIHMQLCIEYFMCFASRKCGSKKQMNMLGHRFFFSCALVYARS